MRALSKLSAITLTAAALYGISTPSFTGTASAASFDFNGPDVGCGGSGQPACSSAFGNMRQFTSTDDGSLNVQVRAWSLTGNSTGSGTGFNDKSENAFLGMYTGSGDCCGLGVTNRDPVGASLTDTGHSSATENNGGDGSGGSSQHTMDNVGRLDFISFFFNQQVQLSQLRLNVYTTGSLGYDSDVQIYVGNAVDGSDAGAAITDADVVEMIANKTLLDLDTLFDQAGMPDEPIVDETSSTSSRFANFTGLEFGNLVILMPRNEDDSGGEDMMKIASLQVTSDIPHVSTPEPMTALTMLGGLAGMVWMRRRAARKAKAQA